MTNTWKSVGHDYYNNPLILSNMQPPKPKSKNTSLDFQTNLKREAQTQNNILADELKKKHCVHLSLRESADQECHTQREACMFKVVDRLCLSFQFMVQDLRV